MRWSTRATAEAAGAPRLAARGWPRAALRLAVAALLLAAVPRLLDGFARLLLAAAPPVDLAYRWSEVQRWFAGRPVYAVNFAVYPPASYAVLWPALGPFDVPAARALWALTAAAGLAWLARTAARECGATGRDARWVAALVPLAAYASRIALVNGQLTLHVLPLALGAALLLDRRPPSWWRDGAAAVLLLGALVKPTLAAPFVWVAATAAAPVRPVALVLAGYAALTALAAAFQPAGLGPLLAEFARGGIHDALRAAGDAHGNLHTWLVRLGLERAAAPATLAVLAALGAWTALARRADVWVRLGAAAIVARTWAFHYRYDDLVIAVAMVPLARMAAAGRRAGAPDAAAEALLALVAASLVLPATALSPAVDAAQTAVWLAALAFLGARGLRPRAGRAAEAPAA